MTFSPICILGLMTEKRLRELLSGTHAGVFDIDPVENLLEVFLAGLHENP
jgi:hypothetical protein